MSASRPIKLIISVIHTDHGNRFLWIDKERGNELTTKALFAPTICYSEHFSLLRGDESVPCVIQWAPNRDCGPMFWAFKRFVGDEVRHLSVIEAKDLEVRDQITISANPRRRLVGTPDEFRQKYWLGLCGYLRDKGEAEIYRVLRRSSDE